MREALRRHLTDRQHPVKYRHSSRSQRMWTPEEDALIGTMPIGELVRCLGRTMRAVKQRRRQLGVPIGISREHC